MADYSLLKSNDWFASLSRRAADGTAQRMPMTTGDHGIKFHPRRQTLPCLHEVSSVFKKRFRSPAWAQSVRFKNSDHLLKRCAPADMGEPREHHRIRRDYWIEKRYLGA